MITKINVFIAIVLFILLVTAIILWKRCINDLITLYKHEKQKKQQDKQKISTRRI